MRLIAVIIVFLGIFSGFAKAETVADISIRSDGAQTYVDIVRAGANNENPRVFELTGDSSRVVVDWQSASMGLKPFAGSGHVSGIRYARRGDAGLRLVFDLVPGARFDTVDISSKSIQLSIQGGSAVIIPAAQESRFFGKKIPSPRLKPKIMRRAKKPLIVIDPGHGGRDPGAIGQAGTYEKSITLKAGKELERQLLATKRYRVLLTRDTDKYIEHEDRIGLARTSGSDLFISIHADSTQSKRVRGASVYTLAQRARKRSQEIINEQNWIMDVDLSLQSDPVGDILVDLAQRKTITQSSTFANILVPRLARTTKMVGNSHREAGYFVLLAPDVPAVLLELGFLSNSDDETLLKSAAHRRKIMVSVVNSIDTYFKQQER